MHERFGKEAEIMAKSKDKKEEKVKKLRPALTPEARENQLISLAVDLAEERLLNGTASSQMIVHFLKLGSTKERLEKEILEEQKDLIKAKTKNIQSTEKTEELYRDALNAFRGYSGQGNIDDEDL